MPPVLGFGELYSGMFLPEHHDPRCRALHYVGTAAALEFSLGRPATLLSSAASVGADLAVNKPLESLRSGLPEFTVRLAVFFGLQWALLGSLDLAAVLLGVGYGCAWVEHFFLEKNRLTTFVHPTLSLMGDCRMFYDAARGGL